MVDKSIIWNKVKIKLLIISVLFLSQFIFEVWMENGSGILILLLKKIPDYLFNNFIFFIVIIICISIFISITQIYQNEIEKLNSVVKDNAIGAWDKYLKFTLYRNKELLSEAFIKFLKNVPEAQAVQLYTQSIKKVNGKYSFKLNYYHGEAFEGVEINSILQEYYVADINFYENYLELKETLKRLNRKLNEKKYSINSSKEFEYKKVDIVKEFCKIYLDDLNKITNITFISEADYFKYIVVKYLIESELFAFEKEVESILKNTSIEEQFKARKRTGILLSFLHGKSFAFKKHSNYRKINRIYISEPVKYMNFDSILLVTLENDLIEEEKSQMYISELLKDIKDN